jgi:hypothetical protein
MQGLFPSRENIGSFQYPVRHRSAKTTRERHRLPLKNSAEPRDQGLGERRIEVAFGPERCACAARFEQRLRTQAARYTQILAREAVRLLVRARRLTMNLLDAHEPGRDDEGSDGQTPSVALPRFALVRPSGRRSPRRDTPVPASGARGKPTLYAAPSRAGPSNTGSSSRSGPHRRGRIRSSIALKLRPVWPLGAHWDAQGSHEAFGSRVVAFAQIRIAEDPERQ